MQLTNHEVTAAAVEDQKRLRMDFDHLHSLRLIDETDQYESFQVEYGDARWIV